MLPQRVNIMGSRRYKAMDLTRSIRVGYHTAKVYKTSEITVETLYPVPNSLNAVS